MEHLLPVVDQVLSALRVTLQDVDAFAVAVGPGSFTSLRVGMATAKAFAHSLGKPLAGAPTLDVLAQGLQGAPGLICPVLPARAREVYAAFYVSAPAVPGGRTPGQGIKRLSGYLALDPQQLAARLQDELRAKITFTGEGALAWWDMLQDALGERAVLAEPAQLWPRAALVAFMGMAALERRHDTSELPDVRPLYVKPPAIRRN